jgi:hypothetical protein
MLGLIQFISSRVCRLIFLCQFPIYPFMACKRLTISLPEEQHEFLREILPAGANESEVVADMINMFVTACDEYDDEFVLDELYNRSGYLIGKEKA